MSINLRLLFGTLVFRLVAYLDGLQAQVSALRAAQAETEKELRLRRTLMPSVPVLSNVEGLDRAFKGEL